MKTFTHIYTHLYTGSVTTFHIVNDHIKEDLFDFCIKEDGIALWCCYNLTTQHLESLRDQINNLLDKEYITAGSETRRDDNTIGDSLCNAT